MTSAPLHQACGTLRISRTGWARYPSRRSVRWLPAHYAPTSSLPLRPRGYQRGRRALVSWMPLFNRRFYLYLGAPAAQFGTTSVTDVIFSLLTVSFMYRAFTRTVWSL